MEIVETVVLNDQLILSRIRNAANWILSEKIGDKNIWAGALLQACEYLEKRLELKEIVINNPGKVVINHEGVGTIHDYEV